jgi:hypothetical protein
MKKFKLKFMRNTIFLLFLLFLLFVVIGINYFFIKFLIIVKVIDNFEKLFYKILDKKSFTNKWVDKSILNKTNDLLIVDICEQAVLTL